MEQCATLVPYPHARRAGAVPYSTTLSALARPCHHNACDSCYYLQPGSEIAKIQRRRAVPRQAADWLLLLLRRPELGPCPAVPVLLNAGVHVASIYECRWLTGDGAQIAAWRGAACLRSAGHYQLAEG